MTRAQTRTSTHKLAFSTAFYRLLGRDAKRNLVENIAGSLSQADAAVQNAKSPNRQIAQFIRADPSYGQGLTSVIREHQIAKHFLPVQPASLKERSRTRRQIFRVSVACESFWALSQTCCLIQLLNVGRSMRFTRTLSDTALYPTRLSFSR
ncbi:catalase-related domain-containing protein [Massilia sp. KIM]|uniref:catalase-related domain-containing protein n=1 Tax=Massilia sp. KIM TaxID=1955422 RepID=UPI0035A31C6E